MSDQYLGEIRAFPFHFAPVGWELCDGQVIPISQNTALARLLGTIYGGDGTSSFGLPNLNGRTPIQRGDGEDLTPRIIGQTGGEETVILAPGEMPAHTHTVSTMSDPGTLQIPGPDRILARSAGATAYQTEAILNQTTMSPGALAVAGASAPHSNLQPYLVLNFCIAMVGNIPKS